MLRQVNTLHFKDNAFASSKSLTRYASAPSPLIFRPYKNVTKMVLKKSRCETNMPAFH